MEGGSTSPKRKRRVSRKRSRSRKSQSRRLKQIKRALESIDRKVRSLRRSPSNRVFVVRTSPSGRPKIFVPPAEYRFSAASKNFWRPKIGPMRANEYEFNNRYYATRT